jgi:hypothetical protein
MSTIFKILAVLSITCLAIGMSDVGNNMVSGFCRAIGSVFFILAFITKVIQKAEAGA